MLVKASVTQSAEEARQQLLAMNEAEEEGQKQEDEQRG
jgi:hypothetical protein